MSLEGTVIGDWQFADWTDSSGGGWTLTPNSASGQPEPTITGGAAILSGQQWLTVPGGFPTTSVSAVMALYTIDPSCRAPLFPIAGFSPTTVNSGSPNLFAGLNLNLQFPKNNGQYCPVISNPTGPSTGAYAPVFANVPTIGGWNWPGASNGGDGIYWGPGLLPLNVGNLSGNGYVAGDSSSGSLRTGSFVIGAQPPYLQYSYAMVGKLYRITAFSSLTAAQYEANAAVYESFATGTKSLSNVGANPTTGINLVGIGDSRMNQIWGGDGNIDIYGDWFSSALVDLCANSTGIASVMTNNTVRSPSTFNLSVSGRTMGSNTTTASTMASLMYAPGASKNVAVFFGVTNDLSSGSSPATALSAVETIVSAYETVGFDCIILPETNRSDSFATDCTSYNSLLTAHSFGANVSVTSPTTSAMAPLCAPGAAATKLFADGLHPKQWSADCFLAPATADAINALFSVSSSFYPPPADVNSGVKYGLYDTAFVGTETGSTSTDPGIANVRHGTAYEINGSSLMGSCYVPAAANVLTGVNVDATTGTLTLPAASYVLTTAGTYGVGGDGTTPTYTPTTSTDPGVANVLSTVTYEINGASHSGIYVPPTASEVISTASFGAGSGTAGTVVLPAASAVESGTTFGPDSDLMGTYSGGGGSLTYEGIASAVVDAMATAPVGSVAGTVTLNLTQAIPTSNTAQTLGDSLNAARAQGFGKWALSGTSLALYAGDNATVVRTFTLDSATSPTTRS